MVGLGNKEREVDIMYDYVSKKEFMPVKKELIKLINMVQDEVHSHFTFRFDFIGSASRNMITREVKGNCGYDFDVNIRVNDEEGNYGLKEIKDILRNAFDKYSHLFLYDYAEDSSRVITIKVKDKVNSRILHSCDFAVVYDCSNGRQKYIRHNKNQKTYYWEYQPEEFYKLTDKIKWIKENGLWQKVREKYLEMKSNNTNPNKKSRSIFAETVAAVYNENKSLII